MLESKSNFHQKIDSRQVNFPSDERDVTFRIRPIVALSALLCTRKRRFHSSKKRISLWVAFSRRQFFAPLNRDDLQDLLSSSVSRWRRSNRIYARVTSRPLFCLYSTFVYTFMVAPQRRQSVGVAFLSRIILKSPSSIDPQPCRLLSCPSLGSSFFPFLVPSLSLSLSLSLPLALQASDTERERWNPQIGKWERPHLRECEEGGGRRSVSHICESRSRRSMEYREIITSRQLTDLKY